MEKANSMMVMKKYKKCIVRKKLKLRYDRNKKCFQSLSKLQFFQISFRFFNTFLKIVDLRKKLAKHHLSTIVQLVEKRFVFYARNFAFLMQKSFAFQLSFNSSKKYKKNLIWCSFFCWSWISRFEMMLAQFCYFFANH